MSISDAQFVLQIIGLALFVGIGLAVTSLKVVYNFVASSFRHFTRKTEQEIHAIYDGFRGAIPAFAVALLFVEKVKPLTFFGIACVAVSIGYLIGSWNSPRRLY